MILDRQDKLNLVMIFAPILLILALLLTSKQDVGCGLLGGVLGAERVLEAGRCIVNELPWVLQLVQNSAGDAGSAGWLGRRAADGTAVPRSGDACTTPAACSMRCPMQAH